MLEQLNGIRWDELKHNYGAADDIPGLLRQIIDGPAADEALFKLENNLFHQGGWICSAAPAAVPFLVELAAAPGVPLRSKLVALVGNVAYEAGELRGRGVDPAWQEAWAASIPPLLELLDDADVHVRRMTTWALGAARPQAETVVERLRARWPAEPDLTVRLGLVLAAGKLSPHGATWLQGLREHPEPQVRLAATMALGRLAADIDLVCGAVRDGDLAAWRHNPWYGGTPESLVWGIDDELGGHCRARIRFATRMLAHRDPQVRIGGVKAAGVVLSTWLSALPELLPPLVEHLDDPDATVRAFALHLLVASGEAGPHLDRLAAMLADETRLSRRGKARIADVALWGLACRAAGSARVARTA